MKAKNIFLFSLLFFGEVLIIFGFVQFNHRLTTEILSLNIAVSSLIYCLLFIDILIPWVDFNDKSQKTIGSIGLRWFFTFLYMLFAIAAMVIFNTAYPLTFSSQLLIHGFLSFFILMGLFFAVSSAAQAEKVYDIETHNRGKIDEMKKQTKELQLRLDTMKTIPADILFRINSLQENLRFLSPSANQSASVLEQQFIEQMKIVGDCFYNTPLDFQKIDEKIKDCERTLKERKQIFSI
jgi:hypothetical protein